MANWGTALLEMAWGGARWRRCCGAEPWAIFNGAERGRSGPVTELGTMPFMAGALGRSHGLTGRADRGGKSSVLVGLVSCGAGDVAREARSRERAACSASSDSMDGNGSRKLMTGGTALAVRRREGAGSCCCWLAIGPARAELGRRRGERKEGVGRLSSYGPRERVEQAGCCWAGVMEGGLHEREGRAGRLGWRCWAGCSAGPCWLLG